MSEHLYNGSQHLLNSAPWSSKPNGTHFPASAVALASTNPKIQSAHGDKLQQIKDEIAPFKRGERENGIFTSGNPICYRQQIHEQHDYEQQRHVTHEQRFVRNAEFDSRERTPVCRKPSFDGGDSGSSRSDSPIGRAVQQQQHEQTISESYTKSTLNHLHLSSYGPPASGAYVNGNANRCTSPAATAGASMMTSPSYGFISQQLPRVDAPLPIAPTDVVDPETLKRVLQMRCSPAGVVYGASSPAAYLNSLQASMSSPRNSVASSTSSQLSAASGGSGDGAASTAFLPQGLVQQQAAVNGSLASSRSSVTPGGGSSSTSLYAPSDAMTPPSAGMRATHYRITPVEAVAVAARQVEKPALQTAAFPSASAQAQPRMSSTATLAMQPSPSPVLSARLNPALAHNLRLNVQPTVPGADGHARMSYDFSVKGEDGLRLTLHGVGKNPLPAARKPPQQMSKAASASLGLDMIVPAPAAAMYEKNTSAPTFGSRDFALPVDQQRRGSQQLTDYQRVAVQQQPSMYEYIGPLSSAPVAAGSHLRGAASPLALQPPAPNLKAHHEYENIAWLSTQYRLLQDQHNKLLEVLGATRLAAMPQAVPPQLPQNYAPPPTDANVAREMEEGLANFSLAQREYWDAMMAAHDGGGNFDMQAAHAPTHAGFAPLLPGYEEYVAQPSSRHIGLSTVPPPPVVEEGGWRQPQAHPMDPYVSREQPRMPPSYEAAVGPPAGGEFAAIAPDDVVGSLPGHATTSRNFTGLPDAEYNALPVYERYSPLPDAMLERGITAERVVKPVRPQAFKFFMEQHVENVRKQRRERDTRMTQLEKEMAKGSLGPELMCNLRQLLTQKESRYLRLKRQKMNKSMFEQLKAIGLGAFGEVSLVRKHDTRALYAMKTLRKSDIIKRNQAAHVKAERDILSEADNEWVVKLFYSFQDRENLFFIMEYIPGGDMMTLLIKKGIFDEQLAQFYIAELVSAIESVHKLGFIHRDIKPDNILIDEAGHIKLTDFGLCTGLRWTHESKYYLEDQKQAGGHGRQDSFDLVQMRNCDCKVLDYRNQKQRCKAHSLVGTPNYIAPEVLLRTGYGQLCDWWSVGVILYEMLIGRPPFLADQPDETQMKIIQWKQNLDFPPAPQISHAAMSLIEGLLCDQENRLGRAERGGADEIKRQPFFANIDWEHLRSQVAPYRPEILHAEDTSNFDPIDHERPARPDGDVDGLPPMSASEHAFYEFTFRRFFDDNSDPRTMKARVEEASGKSSVGRRGTKTRRRHASGGKHVAAAGETRTVDGLLREETEERAKDERATRPAVNAAKVCSAQSSSSRAVIVVQSAAASQAKASRRATAEETNRSARSASVATSRNVLNIATGPQVDDHEDEEEEFFESRSEQQYSRRSSSSTRVFVDGGRRASAAKTAVEEQPRLGAAMVAVPPASRTARARAPPPPAAAPAVQQHSTTIRVSSLANSDDSISNSSSTS